MELYSDTVLQTIREPMLVLSGDFRVTAGNKSFYRTFHVTSEQTTGHLVSELGNGQWNIPALLALLAKVLPGDSEFNEYQIEHDFPDIGRRTMLLNGRPMRNGGKDSSQILLAIEDITERRRGEAEVSLRQRTWYETALASIGDAVVATDGETRVTYLNPTAQALTGWGQKEAIGKPLHEVFNIVNEDTRKIVESPVTKAIRQGAIVGLANHTLLISRDGTERAIDDSAAPIRDAHTGDIIGVVMVFHDITERRAVEQRLETSEIRYRRLFEAAHDGILILNVQTRRITGVNPFMLELLDFPIDHFLGKELWEIGIFRDKDANQKAMQELHDKGSIRFEDLPLQDRNGHRHPVEIVANIYLEDQEPVIQCNIRDIGERERFDREREVLLANEQVSRMEAETANRTKDLFLATLSHEVRTPLNAILGWASVLRDGERSKADFQEGMEVIERNCRVQLQLIDDVLDVSRIVSGKMELQLGACELSQIIEASIAVVKTAADAKNIRFETNLDSAASPASCDSARMQQVIWNLLANSVKFSPPGSAIRISLTRERSMARIQISDDGQGITPDFLPFVFDRFRQGDGSTRRKIGGLGLGLSIVKHIVEVHGGTVVAESRGKGLGTTVTVNLPVRAVHDDDGNEFHDPPVLSIQAVRLDGLRVLVVDDEIDARRLINMVLSEAGAVVTAVASVTEAMKVLAETKPQVLLSDIAMPEQDGYDLIRQVREAGYPSKELPAIALMAFAHKDDRMRVLLAGFQVHLPKPIDPHELSAVIASMAGRTGKPVV